MSDFLGDNPLDEEILLRYARKLGIGNLFTDINTKFENPSGGEEKRILFLRAVLGILMNVSEVKCVFLDEITAGLDETSRGKVLALIKELRDDYGISFVIIAHHEIEADEKYSTKVTKIRKPENVKKASSSFCSKLFNRVDMTEEKERVSLKVTLNKI
jgi:ABC-type multidrug transport system ATPase subunit